MLTPIQTFAGQGSDGASAASRSWRLVRTWNVWCSALTMTSKTARRKSSGMSSWNRSLIEFTKIIRERRQRNGCSSLAGHKRKSKPCSYAWPGIPRHRSANVSA